MSLWTRLRSRLSSSKGVAGFRPEPGPFDAPPAEPVELDPDETPWELKDDD
jgi:hypothetical protein